ncbi:DUF4126 family protein [Thiohalomonas denitrificans]|uniref:DUF4126 family protein n=1 Tax=Thiohalomonas denitrificans TaxID=415747 RepID=UPI0026ECFB41|nr:DUF4126 family protein [Thiohalomonas denitrificans]
MRAPGRTLLITAALGLIAGSRSMMAPAVASRLGAAGPQAPPRRQPSRIPITTTLLALAELIADKSPVVGSRLETGPLLFRAASGAISCAVLAPRLGAERRSSAIMGAFSSVVGAYVLATARSRITTRYRVPDPVVGALEDGLALGLAVLVLTGSRGRNYRRSGVKTSSSTFHG